MLRYKRIPSALTIAGSDSGGGAGIQADLKVFAATGVHGLSAVTCVTAQNPAGVSAVQAVTSRLLEQQLEAVALFRPAAMKTGMLFNAGLIGVVEQFTRRHRNIPLVIDPVMVATSGARLLSRNALRALMEKLLPAAILVTPNMPEAATLTGRIVRSVEDQRQAARELVRRFGVAVIVKGGHGRGAEAADVFHDGEEEWLLTAPKRRGIRAHGTGCTFSATVTAGLARGLRLHQAVVQAKEFITGAIGHSRRTGPFTVLEAFWK